MAPDERHSARLDPLHANLSGRSVDARRGGSAGCPAPRSLSRFGPASHSHDADQRAGCGRHSRKPSRQARPAWLAGRPSVHLSRGRFARHAGPHEAGDGLRRAPALRRDRHAARHVRRPMGDPRQSPRCVGLRSRRSRQRDRRHARDGPRPRRTRPFRMEAAPHDRNLPLGWRRARPARLNRMGRGESRRAASESRRLYQHGRRRGRPGFRGIGNTLAERLDTRRNARGSRSGNGRQRVRFLASVHGECERERKAFRHGAASGEGRGFDQSPRRRSWERDRTFRRFSITPEFHRSTWDLAATTASTTRSTTISTG